MQHQFFQQQGFAQPQAQTQNHQSPELQFNTMVMEIYNNWPFARWLMDQRAHGELSKVHPMENEWITFLTQNNIDIEYYVTKELFIDGLWKK